MEILNKIDNETIVERIVSQISDAIVEGKLKPGDKIPTEAEMIKELGVGRNSVREAIKMLSAMGVLEIKRGDGTYIVKEVKPTVFDSVIYSIIMEQSTHEELLELRKTLEIDVLEMVVEKAGQDDMEMLKKLIEILEKSSKEKNFERAAQLDLEFHHKLADIAGNKLLSRIVKGVQNLFYSSIKRTLENYEVYRGSGHKSHRDILQVIKNRDKSKVEEVVQASLEGWKKYIFPV
jgi:GntR family transcriptional regulator, transcriptional repressor for pyruvate dehydrogenase complex